MNNWRVTRGAAAWTILFLWLVARRGRARTSGGGTRMACGHGQRGGAAKMGTRWRTGIATLAVAMATASATIAIAGGTECEKKAAARVNHDCVSCEASVTCLEKVTAAGG